MRTKAISVAILTIGALLGSSGRASASTYTVTRDDDPAVDGCDSDCSFREAVIAANDHAGADTVKFASTISEPVTLSSDDHLSITGTLTILGGGHVIEQTGDARFFEVPAGSTLHLRDVTLSGGIDGDGGAILNDGRTTITSSRLTANHAYNFGGAILSEGELTVSKSTFDANTAGGGGGAIGIPTSGSASIDTSTFKDNAAEFQGGAIGSAGELTIKRSAFITNTVEAGDILSPIDGGGGVSNQGTMTISHSTFRQNHSDEGSHGGNIYNLDTATVSYTAIIGSPSGGGPSLAHDGAVPKALTLTANYMLVGTCSGAVVSGGYNVSGIGCSGLHASYGDVFVSSSQPAPTDPGGPTEVRGIVVGSAAQDLVPSSHPSCAGADQRGVPRPYGSGCDSGPYEIAFCADVLVNVVGTDKGDVLTGSPAADGVLALGGNDKVETGAGEDAICGGPGNDRLRGGADNDVIDGASGDDRCFGDAGSDTFRRCETKRQ